MNFEQAWSCFLFSLLEVEYHSSSWPCLLSVLWALLIFFELAVTQVEYSPRPRRATTNHHKAIAMLGLTASRPSKPINPHITGKLSRWQASHRERTTLETFRKKGFFFPEQAMPRDEETVDRIFAGNLDGLPPLSSKVDFFQPFVLPFSTFFYLFQGGAHLHQFHLHWHVDGEEHADGICLPQDQRVLPWEARTGVPGLDILNPVWVGWHII